MICIPGASNGCCEIIPEENLPENGVVLLLRFRALPVPHRFAVSFSFPQASNQTLLDKFKRQHEGNSYIEFSAVMEPAFIIRHYAGKVKYGVKVSERCFARFAIVLSF